MADPFDGRDFISLMDYTGEELGIILDLASDLKAMQRRGESHEFLEGKILGMMFGKPSTRTRVSFETGITQLGGHGQFYTTDSLQTAHKESWDDTGRVLDRYIDGLVARLYDLGGYDVARNALRAMGENAQMPIINALDDKEHPCQVMADIMTMREKFGNTIGDRKIVLTWGYSKRNRPAGVPQAMVAATSLLGLNLTIAYPEGYELDPAYIDFARRANEVSGGSLEIVHDIYDAAKGADVIYVKNWGSRTIPLEEDLATRGKYANDWCLSERHYAKASRQAYFMHPLPAERNQEVTDEIIDGPRSIVYDEAENRLHAQKAIMTLLMR